MNRDPALENAINVARELAENFIQFGNEYIIGHPEGTEEIQDAVKIVSLIASNLSEVNTGYGLTTLYLFIQIITHNLTDTILGAVTTLQSLQRTLATMDNDEGLFENAPIV